MLSKTDNTAVAWIRSFKHAPLLVDTGMQQNRSNYSKPHRSYWVEYYIMVSVLIPSDYTTRLWFDSLRYKYTIRALYVLSPDDIPAIGVSAY